MADVNISKFRTSVNRPGSAPASPGFAVSEGQDPVHPSGSSNFVTYSGATDNVDLGEFGLEAGFITLDTTPTNTPTAQGTMFWDADDETVDVILNGYTMKIGEDLFYPVKNQTGSTIAKGTAVRFNGTVGASGRLLIAPFIADGSVPSSRFMGVTAEEILNGEDGKVLYFGRIRGINTNAFNEGDILYASTTVAGGFQTAIPVAPNNIVQVAAVVTKSINQGTIFVRPTLGSSINKDEGVKITSVANLDLLQYQSGTALWENKTLAQVIGSAYVPSTRTLTINGTTQDLSADRTFNVGTVTSVGLSSATSGVTIGSTPVTTSGTITLAIATASGSQNGLLSSTDWTTFNNKMPAITFNAPLFIASGGSVGITQASGSFNGFLSSTDWNTFNNKQNALTNPVTGTGTTNYLPKFTGSTTIGNSQVFDNGTGVGINTNNPLLNLQINSNSGSNSTLAFSENNGLKWYARYNVNDGSFSIVDVVNTATRLIINTSGNLGLGVTPSAWGAGQRAFDFGTVGSIETDGDAVAMSNNRYFDGGANRYKINDFASIFVQVNGQHIWYNAPSGTAGNAISFTQAMTLTSGGNLLVGTTTDNGARLQVSGTSTFSNLVSVAAFTTSDLSSSTQLSLTRSGNQFTGIAIRGSVLADRAIFSLPNDDALYIGRHPGGVGAWTRQVAFLDNGNVGIGTSSPASKLQIEGTGTGAWLTINRTDSGTNIIDYTQSGTRLGYIGYIGSDLYLNNATASATAFFTNSTERMRITSSGNVLIGTTSSGFINDNGWSKEADSVVQRHVNGTAGGTAYTWFIYNASAIGSITQNGTTQVLYNTSSDYRLKTDLRDYNGLDLVSKIKTYDFEWKTDKTRAFGVIAHELQEIIEYAVVGNKDGQNMQQVDYSKIVPIMVKAIQELKQEIDTLKN